VTWNADGGTPAPTQTTVNHGANITQPAAMTKTGYTFDKWYTNSGLTTAASFPITATGNTTLYAKWIINTYTVTWNADGGTPAPTQTSVNYGGSIAAPAAMTKTGYTFDKWYTNSGLTTAASFPIANVTAATTLYAKWIPNSYTVTWEADGGTPVPTQTTVNHGASITQPAAMTKTGYTFGGWYTNSGLTTAASFPITATGNTTLYAKWVLASACQYDPADCGSIAKGSVITTAQNITSTDPGSKCYFATSVTEILGAGIKKINGTEITNTTFCSDTGQWSATSCSTALAGITKRDGGYYIYVNGYMNFFTTANTYSGLNPNCQ